MAPKCRPMMLNTEGPRLALRILTGRLKPWALTEEQTNHIGLQWLESPRMLKYRPTNDDIIEAAENLILDGLNYQEDY